MADQHDMQFVTIHGYRRAFVKVGSGPAVLLLHGLGRDHTTWEPVIDALAMAERGEMLMMPPTYLTSLEVAHYAGPAEVIDAAHGRIVEMHTPGLEALGEGWTLSVPEHLRSVLASHTGS